MFNLWCSKTHVLLTNQSVTASCAPESLLLSCPILPDWWWPTWTSSLESTWASGSNIYFPSCCLTFSILFPPINLAFLWSLTYSVLKDLFWMHKVIYIPFSFTVSHHVTLLWFSSRLAFLCLCTPDLINLASLGSTFHPFVSICYTSCLALNWDWWLLFLFSLFLPSPILRQLYDFPSLNYFWILIFGLGVTHKCDWIVQSKCGR